MKKDLAKTICKGCKELLEFEYDPLLVFSEIYSILEDIVKQIDNQIGGKTSLSVFCQNMADVAKYEEETYAPTDNIPADNILNFEDYVRTHKE